MTRRNWFIVVAAYCSILLGAWASTQIEADFSLTTLSARSSEDYQNYKKYTKRFPGDNTGLVISIKSDAKFDSREEFSILEGLRQELELIDGVKSAIAITSVELPRKTLFGSKPDYFSLLKMKISSRNDFLNSIIIQTSRLNSSLKTELQLEYS